MFNDIIFFIRNIFNYLKSFIFFSINNIINYDYKKPLSFIFSGLFFYLLYILIVFLINYFNKNKNFSNSKYNIILKLFLILFSLVTFFFLIVNEENKYFEPIFKKPDLNNNFYKFNNQEFNKLFKIDYKNIFLISLFILLIGTISIIIGFIFMYIFSTFSNNISIMQIFIVLSIIITLLSIFAFVFRISLKSNTCNNINEKNFINKILCILFNLIFFIPCLLIIIAEFVKNEIKYTHPSIFLILIFQIILITSIFLVPEIIKLLKNKNQLLENNEILYLNNYKIISHNWHLENKFSSNNSPTFLFNGNNKYNFSYKYGMNADDYKNKNQLDNNYTIEFEIYLNPQGRNTSYAYNKETELFCFCKKPVIYYDGRSSEIIIKTFQDFDDINNVYKLQELIRFKPIDKYNDEKIENIDNINEPEKIFKFQKWNKFVIKYNNLNVEIILNDIVIGVKKLNKKYSSNELEIPKINLVTIGDKEHKNNGIHGSIKNIYYHTNSYNDWISNSKTSYNINLENKPNNFLVNIFKKEKQINENRNN